MNSSRLALGIGGVVVLLALALCTCCVCGTGGLISFFPTASETTTPDGSSFPWPNNETPAPVDTPTAPTIAPLPGEAKETLESLETAEMPVADLHELGIRFRGVSPDTPRVASTESADYPVGAVRTFQVSNLDEDRNFEIEAYLAFKTDHVYMWVEEGLNVNQRDIEEAALLFEEHTYPTNREFFGSEWIPGVDGDPHLSILHASDLGRTVAGYFSSADSYVTEVRADSNEAEMFYIHVDLGMGVGDPFYNGVLAHEFQHMIHWNNDRNETTWLNEGCSELAMELNNRRYPGGPGYYDVGGSEYAYLDRPDTQLNTWPEVSQTGSASAHYGASYLFMAYFLDRFGDDATQALVAHEENGLDSVDAVLQELGMSFDHQMLFADWVVANLLDDPELAEGQFGYTEIDVLEPDFETSHRKVTPNPVREVSTVRQYGVDYIEVENSGPLTFSFTGATQTKLMDTDAYSGRYLWWSNRADESNPRLSRIVDLTDATSAELEFWSWYHIESDWDYAYVVVGTTDDGSIPADLNSPEINWHILNDPGLSCTTTDPNNGNLGCGITGQSSGWQEMSADLSTYVGQEIVLRFEYVTDAAVNQAGFALDDIRLTVDGVERFSDDAESRDSAWISEGFVRHANVLPQAWTVQLITYGEEIGVERLILDDGHTGTWTLPFGSDVSRVILAISAMAQDTTEPATYEYSLTP